MSMITWSDKIGSRGRRPFLLLVRGDEIAVFGGQNIPGIAVVRGTDYEKKGKWSSTTYRLEIAGGVRVISGREGWETGRFVEGLGCAVGVETPDRWAEVAAALQVSVPAAMRLLRSWRPEEARRLDGVEEALASLEESSEKENDTVITTVSFGNPSRGQMRAGWWTEPKGIPGYNAELRLKDPQLGWVEGNIDVVGIDGRVLSVVHEGGMHGGYYAVSVAVVPGTETCLPGTETEIQGTETEITPLETGGNTAIAAALHRAGL